MIIKYIDRNGNLAETEDIVHIPANLYQVDKVWFEKREEVVEKKVKEVKEVKEIQEVEPSEVVEDVELQEKAKEFLKEKKVKGYGLLKGDNIVKRAKELGFNL